LSEIITNPLDTRAEQDWQEELDRWLQPFLEVLDNDAQRHWAPFYLRGQLGPLERKSMTRIAQAVAPGQQDQLNNFIAVAPWASQALQKVLVQKANALVGGREAHLIIDDFALPKKGEHSVGVAPQYCGALGKKANCQSIVSLTLARRELPVPIALRLYLPESWADDKARRDKCGVPEAIEFRPKWQLALAELDRVIALGARFGDVLADADYGHCAEFRAGLEQRHLCYGVGIMPNQQVYSPEVELREPVRDRRGRPAKHPTPTLAAVSAEAMIAAQGEAAWQRVAWRQGTQGELSCEFIALRVRVADGPLMAKHRHLPGAEAWLVAERRESGEIKYYLSNLAREATLWELARQVKGRWVCEQGHQQMKEELGVDHFEGRGWVGLHHHLLMTMMALCFLQHLRLGGKKRGPRPARRPGRACPRCAGVSVSSSG
jgi:SRSO17 transposase